MDVKAREPRRFHVESPRFANTPACTNHVSQRCVVMLLHLVTRLNDPHAKAFLALVSQSQHVAGHVYHGVRRGPQTLLARLANHVHGIGRAVDSEEGAGDVAILVAKAESGHLTLARNSC